MQLRKIALVLMISISMVAFGQSEKEPDTQEFSVNSRVDSTNGELTGALTYDRQFGAVYDGSCNATSNDSSNDGVPYQVFDIVSMNTENLVVSVTLGSLGDSVMTLYCDGFDPNNPGANIVAYDDDGGVGLASAFTEADGIQIQGGVPYQLVVAGFGAGDTGTFTLDLGNATIFGRSIPTLGEWGMIAFLLTLVGAAVFMIRRQRLAA